MKAESENNRRPRKSTPVENDGPIEPLKGMMKHTGGRIKSTVDIEDLKQKMMEQLSRIEGDSDAAAHVPDEIATETPETIFRIDETPIEIHSEEVQEILGYIPNWIIRWGITVLVATILLLILGSWFVRYPDILTANIDITTNNPPVFLKARMTGRLENLLIQDRQEVTRGQYLAILESTANYEDVLLVKKQLEIFKDGLADSLLTFENERMPSQSYFLGDLQPDYEDFINNCRDYRHFYDAGYYRTKLASLRDQWQSTRQNKDQLANQAEILEEEYSLNGQQHERMETLFERQMVSALELENSRSKLLQKQYALEGARIAVTNASLRVSQLEQGIRDLEQDSLQTVKRLRADLDYSRENLLSGIMAWEQKFVLKAPMDGIVSIIRYWSEDQNVDIGDNVLAVLPDRASDLLGRIELPLQGSGKVRTGQEVNVKFMNYPHTEYGMVRGIVRSRSLVPEKDAYILTVSFPDGLVTNYGVTLQFTQNLKGSAEIITDDLRLFERILNRTKSYLAR